MFPAKGVVSANPMRSHSWPLILLLALAALTGVPLRGQTPSAPVQPFDQFSGKPRVAIVSDIGNEPDDQMSLVRLLVYSNELDLEALVASTSVWQRHVTHPETMHQLIAAYAEVRTNLLLHASGWPTQEELDSRVSAGQPDYGMAAVGVGRNSAGSSALVTAMEKNDPRPLWICFWGGENTLAQALLDLRAKHTADETAAIVGRLRVYAISDQDDSGMWIRREFPGILWVGSPSTQNSAEYVYATWTGISGDQYYRNSAGADTSLVTNEWLDRNVRAKGPLGKTYPKFMFIMEGDTPSFLGLLDNGLNSYRRPDWGGWGGRYVYRQPRAEAHAIWTQGGDEFFRATSQDAVIGLDGREHVSDQATIWRWRAAYQNDFAARMDWTVMDFEQANHNPVVTLNGSAGSSVLRMDAKVGDDISLDATGTTDPNRHALHYRWWLYPEAGLDSTHGADVTVSAADEPHARIHVNSACRPGWLPGIPCQGDGVAHIILEVTNEGSPALTSYRRVILTVHNSAGGASSTSK